MIFKLHYWLLASGANALGVLLGVFMAEYTDASTFEIGLLFMLMPFTAVIFRPIICSFADRKQAHQRYLICCLLVVAVSYLPFVVVPICGPQLYLTHSRFCWYFLVTFKTVGDIAFGGAQSIGDSLAVNYAHRIGTDFSVYRVWATISWMFFGIVVSQINEIWFLPKYVPAFIILISATLLDSFCIWLWPPDYFVMVPITEKLRSTTKEAAPEERVGAQSEALGTETETAGKKKENMMTKSLMPREVVWAHSKRKLLSLLSCSCFRSEASDDQRATVASIESTGRVAEGPDNKIADKSQEIDRRTQIRILLLLLKRDPRILLYAVMFVFAGATVIPLSFFYMQLSDVCHQDNRCDFSQLGGFLQVSMASVETLIFLYIKRIIETLGRLNTASFAFFLAAAKYNFYAFLWPSLNPYSALISEIPHGVYFSIYLTLMVELAHFFSNEVEFLIPELVEKGIVASDDELSNAKLKMSLSATMQALMASANDGLGRGGGALIFGAIVNNYSYHALWVTVGMGSAVVFVLVQFVNIFDRCLDLRLGLDEQFKRNMVASELALGDHKLDPLAIKARAMSRANSIHSRRISGASIRLAQVA